MHPRHIPSSTPLFIVACLLINTVFLQNPVLSAGESLELSPLSTPEDAVWVVMESGTDEILSGVWGHGGIVFVVGSKGTILRFDGENSEPMTSGTTEDLQGVWGTSPENVYAVGGGGLVLHYDGDLWTPVNTPTTEFLRGAWGTSPVDIFITGTRGTIIHYDGIRWDSMESNSPNRLYDIWGASNEDIFVAGHLATILHYDGAQWSPMTSGVRPTLWGVWGTSGDDVFIVGGTGIIIHYDGNAWESQYSGTEENLLRIWGRSQDDAFVVGSGGTILHWNGEFWTSMDTPTTRTLKGVFGDDTGNVYAAGDAGAILRLNPAVPVFIDYFDAAIDGMQVSLAWRVTSSEPVGGFSVERYETATGRHDTFYYFADTKTARDTSIEPGKRYRYALTTTLLDGSRVRSQWVDVSTPLFVTRLERVHPNPFNPSTTISYRVASPSPVSISIYDVSGTLVRRLIDNRSHAAGEFVTTWDGSNPHGKHSASGVYFCTLESNNHVETTRIVFLK